MIFADSPYTPIPGSSNVLHWKHFVYIKGPEEGGRGLQKGACF